jgi:hypothetical protein
MKILSRRRLKIPLRRLLKKPEGSPEPEMSDTERNARMREQEKRLSTLVRSLCPRQALYFSDEARRGDPQADGRRKERVGREN